MDILLSLIPLLPLLSACLLLFWQPKVATTQVIGVGSVSLAALLAVSLNIALWDQTQFVLQTSLGQWLTIDKLSLSFTLYLDPLSLVMITIITCIGALIHLYSASYMKEDADICRFFVYLNLFVSAMLFLVLADNLILLYLGWEGVGLCSYLLIGFWYREVKNSQAANKAFIITRIGDTAMLIGIILIFYQFDTLNIQQIQAHSQQLLQNSELLTKGAVGLTSLCCLLLFAGAAGKSAQVPLHSWLPDAMAGPTPVSALIHAATMVTAGIYLVARNIELFSLAPDVLHFIAIVGVITLILGATSALAQTDLKRILAYSTISQLGYMFLALGVGSASAAVFHLMTHAFFKALLFLSAGALIYCMHHEKNIFKMGGLRKSQPLLALSFGIGCAALASLPMTSGFFSKELILERTLFAQQPILWWGGVVGAFFTALYSAKLFFVIFFGKLSRPSTHNTPRAMAAVLIALMLLSLIGGIQPQGVFAHFAALEQSLITAPPLSALEHWLPIFLPVLTVILAWFLFIKGMFTPNSQPSQPSVGAKQQLQRFLHSGWAFDSLYHLILVKPFRLISAYNRRDIVDQLYRQLERLSSLLYRQLNRFQTGQLRHYSASLVIFCVLAIAWGLTQ
ncbi:NADH-quinone oxidoreductase subunit L [Shewanella woodyi]|uniref:Proton-translocating NADH-quinone oxidoreductase, chain L n=1 Tax=Shewanella woodyi (strain ATCC 51908 / MS32) TaxID=392500 RepID=B1KJV8_SHEWM|nr:NADH-quinone oxidoreductase subunit L [Shewanella woodyi]ACA87145.1 proton-translocating NADH-quinone oxidoreductase, chain L [Shewanella woodyi ATCC 51908]